MILNGTGSLETMAHWILDWELQTNKAFVRLVIKACSYAMDTLASCDWLYLSSISVTLR